MAYQDAVAQGSQSPTAQPPTTSAESQVPQPPTMPPPPPAIPNQATLAYQPQAPLINTHLS
ncbi:hypothetical protein MMC07_009850, partial [Pseudocyphellaria aurata]|nr:hypothetical protein [Pseudocyphellaria aurata]